MTMIYSNPARENDEHALPDVEVWEHSGIGRNTDPRMQCVPVEGSTLPECSGNGWYWRTLNGSTVVNGEGRHLPSGIMGPFDSEDEAIADAQSGSGESVNREDYVRSHALPPCAIAMGCLCAGHARGNPASAPCDTSEQGQLISPDDLDGAAGAGEALATLEQAIRDVCDQDTQNAISDRYRELMGETDDDDDDTPDPDHEHVWGELESSHLAGTVHRKCQVAGCKAVNALDDDDDDEPADDEPGEDDYYLSDDERSSYYHGRTIAGPVSADAEPSPQDAVMRELAKVIDNDGYAPNVWKYSDHGNSVLISVQECGCYFTEHIGKACDRAAKD